MDYQTERSQFRLGLVRSATSRYTFIRGAVMKGASWWWGALACLTVIVGGTFLSYVHFASQRPLVVGLGVGALLLLIFEALYREYGSSSEAEQRAQLLRVLTETMEEGRNVGDEYGRAYGGWWTQTASRIEELDPGYAAEFRMVNSSRRDSLRKLQDIMRAVRVQGSHLVQQPVSSIGGHQ
jgi:hypothetical protein